MNNDDNKTEFFTTAEVAKLFKCSPKTVYSWITQGKLKACILGDGQRQNYRVTDEQLDDFIHDTESHSININKKLIKRY